MNEREQPEEPVGGLGEEAAKLVDALAEWARQQQQSAGAGATAFADAAAATTRRLDEHLATGAEECRYCPVCRVVHAVRETSPEVRVHLIGAAQSLLQAASGMLASAAPTEERSDRVEHIDVDDGVVEDWEE